MSLSPARLIFVAPFLKMIGTIAVDVFERESYTRKSKLTEYPIETGSVISDQIVNSPQEIELDGVIGVMSINQLVNLGSGFADVFDQINALIDNKTLVTLVLGLKTYENMHIESFVVNRDKQNSQGLVFSMSCKQAVFVTSQTTNSQIGVQQADGSINYGSVTSGQNNVSEYKLGVQDAKTATHALGIQAGLVH